MATIHNQYPPITSAAGSVTSWNYNTTVPVESKPDRITFEIDSKCRQYDPGMYYMMLAYLYKHIEGFEQIVQSDDDFRQYNIKTKVTGVNGEFKFTVFYDKDVTKG